MTSAEKYVAAAYLVVLVAVLGYVAIMSAKLTRLERELDDLAVLARERQVAPAESQREAARVG